MSYLQMKLISAYAICTNLSICVPTYDVRVCGSGKKTGMQTWHGLLLLLLYILK